jgi:hypothetical protein
MNRIITAKKRLSATVALVLSTLSSYFKLVGVVVCERLWQIPERQLRSTGALANSISRRLP